MDQSNMSSTDIALLKLERFKPLFLVDSFFQLINKRSKILGTPFAITADPKNIDMGCQYIRQSKLTRHDGYAYYCVESDNVDEYACSGAKIITCKGCPFNNLK